MFTPSGFVANSSSTHGQNYKGNKATLFTNELVYLFLWPSNLLSIDPGLCQQNLLCCLQPLPFPLRPLELAQFPCCPVLCRACALCRPGGLLFCAAAGGGPASHITVGRATTGCVSLLCSCIFHNSPHSCVFSLHIYPYICDVYGIMSLLSLFLVISSTAPPCRPQRRRRGTALTSWRDVRKGQLPQY